MSCCIRPAFQKMQLRLAGFDGLREAQSLNHQSAECCQTTAEAKSVKRSGQARWGRKKRSPKKFVPVAAVVRRHTVATVEGAFRVGMFPGPHTPKLRGPSHNTKTLSWGGVASRDLAFLKLGLMYAKSRRSACMLTLAQGLGRLKKNQHQLKAAEFAENTRKHKKVESEGRKDC